MKQNYQYPKIYERVIRNRDLFISETSEENLFEFLDLIECGYTFNKGFIHSDLLDDNLVLIVGYNFIDPKNLFSCNTVFSVDYKYFKTDDKGYKFDIEDYLKYHNLLGITIGQYLRDNVYELL